MMPRLNLRAGLSLLAGLTLACASINELTDSSGALWLSAVEVIPSEGTGAFSASVGLSSHSGDVLECYVVDAAHASRTVYRQTIPAAPSTSIVRFEFTATEPGNYTLYCTPERKAVSVKTAFTVLLPATASSQTATPGRPAPAPSPQAGSTARAGNASPRIIRGIGQKTSLYETYACAANQDLMLAIKGDGTVELSVSGPGFVDHINCTRSASIEGWSIVGADNPAAETATFISCNNGGFSAEGSLKYAGGVMSGAVTCSYNKGSSAGKPAMKLSIP